MRQARMLPIGCNGRGAQDSSPARPVSFQEPPLQDQFEMVKRHGFDFLDRMPLADEEEDFARLSGRFDLPVLTASGVYVLGPDYRRMLRANMQRSRRAGALLHNMMVFGWHSENRWATDDEVLAAWLEACEIGAELGIEPCFELHVNMWSEDPRRIALLADASERRGVRFNLTLDYSHVLFKIGDPEELDLFGLRPDVEAGRVILEPDRPGNLVDLWLQMGIVRWLQVRAAVPAGPRNLWSRHDPANGAAAVPDNPLQRAREGRFGRAILYPFTRPAPGEWHSDWDERRLDPCKLVARKVLDHHFGSPGSRLKVITTDMINLTDYADAARFSLIGQNAAIADWLRGEMQARAAAGPAPNPA